MNCPHGAEGMIFRLDTSPACHGDGVRALEWCPGCGAYRLIGPECTARTLQDEGGWILPARERTP